MNRLPAILALLAAALLLAVSGCEDDDDSGPCGCDCAVGAIAGRVETGGVPAVVRVSARAVGPGHVDFVHGVDTDSTGAYRLDLPAGAYYLTAETDEDEGVHSATAYYGAGGPPYPYETADTLVVTADTLITADFLLGSLQIEVDFPGALEGSEVTFHVYAVEAEGEPDECPRDLALYQRTEVSSGRAAAVAGGLPTGAFLLHMQVEIATAGGWVEQELWLPATRSCAQAETLRVPAGGLARFEGSLSAETARVTGSIAGSWRTLHIARPEVTLVAADSSAVVARIVPLEDGTFAADILVPEPVRARIDISGSQRWYPRGSFPAATVFELAPGVAAPPIELVESGLVLEIDYPLHQPDWRAHVQLVSPSDGRVVAALQTAARQGDLFRAFPNLDPGEYRLRITPTEFLKTQWRPQWYDRAARPQDAALVLVPEAGGVGRATIVLEDGGVITGDIYYENTPDTYGVLVYVTDAAEKRALGRLRPADGG